MSDAVLTVDIGATNLRVSGCIYQVGSQSIEVLWTETEATGTEIQLRSLLLQCREKLLAIEGVNRIIIAAIGCPGKVSRDRRSASFTALNPSDYLPIADWLETAGVQRVLLFNDLECGCYGVSVTPLSQLYFLTGSLPGGIPNTFMVGMPGTGLGVGFWMDGKPHPSEGGHGLFSVSPNDPVECRVWEGLLQKDPNTLPVYDDLACGKGLAFLAKCLNTPVDQGGKQMISELSSIPGPDLPGTISRWAKDSSTPSEQREFALQVFSCFGKFLGRALQAPVLTALPQALFLAGTIAMVNLPFFQDEFLTAFHSHRYHSDWLKSLPIALVKDPELNLLGAIEAARHNIIRWKTL